MFLKLIIIGFVLACLVYFIYDLINDKKGK